MKPWYYDDAEKNRQRLEKDLIPFETIEPEDEWFTNRDTAERRAADAWGVERTKRDRRA